MTNLTISTLDGRRQELAGESLDRFARDLDGSIILPGSQAFEDAIAIWNGSITKRPSLVVAAESVSDVRATVELARDNGLELSIKGGGHNIAGLALSDGGITLDLALMNSVVVDADARSARVGPGCNLGHVDRETQRHGLATTMGFVSLTGVAGLTLGGGFGYLTRQFGWTVDALVEAQLVLASGEVVKASRTRHEDLFWALRGGGGNFGVVTEFVFDLYEIGPQVMAGLIAWSADQAEGVLDLFQRVTDSAPREMTVAALMRNAPPAPWLPEDKHGKPMIAFVVNHTGPAAQMEKAMAPIRSHGEPWADLIEVKSYTEQQSLLDSTMPKGMHYYWKSEFVPGLSKDLLDTYRSPFDGLTAPANQAVLFHLAGRLNELPEDDGAVGNRDAGFACVIQSMYPGDAPAEVVEANKEWVRSGWQDLKRFSTGGNYINFQTEDEGEDRARESYRGNMARLSEVKAKYDPNNLFRVNRNILPV